MRSEKAIFVLLCWCREKFDKAGSSQLAETSIREAEAQSHSGVFVPDSTPSHSEPQGV